MNVGLALSGGAARGIAHIGVLKYLEEKKVKPCCIAGTSAGSIVGAMFCSGKTAEEIEDAAKTISWKDLLKLSIPRKGLIKSERLLAILEKYIGDIEFSDLKIPLMINAVDLLSGEEVVITEGKVAEAVQASCAMPGIFTPVRLGEHLFVDGGLLDNVPVTVMEKFDLDYIIAVDVGAQKPLQKEPDSIFEVIIQSFDIIRRQRDMPAHELADIIIEPELGDILIWDISKIDLLIERGYEAAGKALQDVDLLRKKGKILNWLSRRRKKKAG
ncbi:MAG: patatin-like phospholipase family protein [Firmicutes bacterium]|nr:patatin-like phospholipase family protein [Bacillota bacterium]